MKVIRHKKKANRKENTTKSIIKVSLSSLVKTTVKSCVEHTTDTTELVPKEFVEAILTHCQNNYQLKGQDKVLEELRSVLVKLSLRMNDSIASVYLLDIFMQRIPLFAAIVNHNFRQIVTAWEKSGILTTSNVNNRIREYVVQMTELWSITYGDNLREFDAMLRYLREGLSIYVPSVEEKLRQVLEQKQTVEMKNDLEYFASLDQMLRVSLPETAIEAKSSLDRLQESFDQLFNDIHFTSDNSHQDNNTPTNSNEINWDEIAWENDEEIDEVESIVAPVISGDMRLVIDPLHAINHPDKEEILQAVSTIASDLVRLYSVMTKYRRRIEDFILQHQPSSSSSSAKPKYAPAGYDVNAMLEQAESNRNELRSIIRSVKRALQEQCRSLLNRSRNPFSNNT